MSVCEVNRVEEFLKNQTAEQKVNTTSGPANPYARRVAVLRGAMLRVVEERNMENVMRKCTELAEKGNLTAMRMFLEYTVGKPLPAANPDRLDGDEWKCFTQTAQMSAELGTVMKSLEPEIPLEMARNVRPILSEMTRAEFVDSLLSDESGMAMRTGETPVLRRGSPSTNGGIGGLASLLGGKVGKRRRASASANPVTAGK